MFQVVLTCVVGGWFARAAAQQCGEVLRVPGIFNSPNYPEPYSSDLRCEWEIITERGIRISLEFLNPFAIERKRECTKDAVIIYDWKEDGYVEVARLCGTSLPPNYKSSFNKLKVVLKTDNNTNLEGFKAQWSTTCGGNYIATEKPQILYSPGYPNYWPNMSCQYKIEVNNKSISNESEEREKIGVYKFLNFKLEDFVDYSYECDNDYVTLQSYYNDYYHKIDERHCGIKNISENYFIKQLNIHFVSDKAVERNGFAMAFSLYTCGGRITEPTNITASHYGSFTDGQNCTWTIEAPHNKIVIVKFSYLKLPAYRYCDYSEYIKLYDGLIVKPNRQLAAICGTTNYPLVVPASGNTMTFEYYTDRQGDGFAAEIIFGESETEGCGGLIDATNFTSFILESPNLNLKNTEEFIDCVWNIFAREDQIIKFQLTSLFLPECTDNYNQNILEVRDGIVPDSLLLGSYCGSLLPLQVSSSSNRLSVRMSAVATSKFTATITAEQPNCKPVVVKLTNNLTSTIFSPGYDTGYLARGINCEYEFQADRGSAVHLIIKNLNIQPGTAPGLCDKDKLIIGQRSIQKQLGQDYVLSNKEVSYVQMRSLFWRRNFDFENVNLTNQYEFCGSHSSIELYLLEGFYLNLITTPENVSLADKGLEIELSMPQFCTRNYTEPFGRILNDFTGSTDNSCYTLITAPEGYTISAYFMAYPTFMPYEDTEHLDVYDGNSTTSKMIYTTKDQFPWHSDNISPVFSTGRYLLINNVRNSQSIANFDLIYTTSNKGRGCGGYMLSDMGVVSSPIYPRQYKGRDNCEFELETPPGTRIFLLFKDVDVSDCKNNHLQIVQRNGQIVRNLCDEANYNYTSTDNYVKLVSKISPLSSYGMKWFAMFASVSLY